MGYVDPDRKRQYQRAWIAERREKFFLGKECARCRSTEQLELDHVDPATKVGHRIWSWSTERREAELVKCQVLCRVCHQAKSDEYQSHDKPCGTWQAYKRRGCRCTECRCAWAAFCRETRKKRNKALHSSTERAPAS